MIKVLFFGPVAERIGSTSLQAEHRAGLRLQDLRDELSKQFPDAFGIVSFMAVNGAHARDLSQELADNSEVAFMAKFSGG
jgi:molybdopterin converting factor small subunit